MLLDLAGVSAIIAVPAVLASAFFAARFFGGAGERYGRRNDVAAVAVLLLLIPPALGVQESARDSEGPWLVAVTVLAVAGMVIGAAGQLLLVAGIIDLQTSFLTGGVAIVPVLAWLGVLAWLFRDGSPLPAYVGVLALAILILSAFVLLMWTLRFRVATWAVSAVLTAALSVLFGALGVELISAP